MQFPVFLQACLLSQRHTFKFNRLTRPALRGEANPFYPDACQLMGAAVAGLCSLIGRRSRQDFRHLNYGEFVTHDKFP